MDDGMHDNHTILPDTENEHTEERVHAEKKSFFSYFSFMRTTTARILGAVVLVVAIAGGAYTLYKNDTFHLPDFFKPEYVQAYSLVPDSISQSAPIPITVPDGVSTETAQAHITFTPAIAGVWAASADEKIVIYKPEKKLKLDRYYTVTLASEEGIIGKDFKVAEDPRVVSVFPRKDTETPEDSEVTIIFNRPMVPITTLDELENYAIPVGIMPETAGRFKWSGTHTLQFIPDDTLIASQHYTVSIREGFFSLDGLPLEAFTHTFDTRALRYESVQSGELIYNQPMRVVFNQPVNLERITQGITVEDTAEKRNVDIEVRYGTRTIYDREKKTDVEIIDESILEIRQAHDAHNRKGLWDFKKTYYLNIQTAYPKAGDIIIEDDRGGLFAVTDVIKSVYADSDRSQYVRSDLFDPEGVLVVEFYEPIDIGGSRISADHVQNIAYGEKCAGDAYAIYGSSETCETVEDKTKLLIRFDANAFTPAQAVAVVFKKIKNTDGLVINPATIKEQVTIFPNLVLLQTIPKDAEMNTSLTDLYLCSNTPIRAPAAEDRKKAIYASEAHELKYWNNPTYITSDIAEWYHCGIGQFETNIGYGLMPQTNYTFTFNLSDDFGQAISATRSFKTGDIPDKYLNFHHLQNDYSVTPAGRTTLTYETVNMDFVHVQICELSAQDMLATLEKKPDYTAGPSIGRNCVQTYTDRIELPKRYWIKNHFQLDLAKYGEQPLGHYVITFWNPNYTQQYGDKKVIYERSYVSITNLAVVEKNVYVDDSEYVYDKEAIEENKLSDKNKARLRNVYWVTNTADFTPANGARIDLYTDRDENDVLEVARTLTANEQGIAESTPFNRLRGAVVTRGADSAVLYSGENTVQSSSVARDDLKLYLYTDRPIYKPGQEVHIKGLFRIGYDGNYDTAAGMAFPVHIYNSEGQEIATKDLTVDQYGTINTTITLDTKAKLGGYRIEAKGNSAYFDVEEYVPAPFKVDVASDKDEYIFGDTALINVDANYYFGVPLEGGVVEYGITSQTYHFDKFDGDGFSFGGGWYGCYDGCSYGDSFVLRNSALLGENGRVQIGQALDYDTLFKASDNEESKLLTYFITVKNPNGQSVSAQKSIIVHRGEFYVSVKADSYFVGTNKPVDIAVKSVDTEGAPKSVNNITVSVNKTDWVYYKRQEVDGGYYYTWEKRLTPIQTDTISTNASGDWSQDIPFSEAGEYEIIARASDSRGNRIVDTYYMYVYGDGDVSIRPTNDTSLSVVTDKASLNAGDSASVVIASPYKRARALITLERGTVYEYQVVDITSSLYQYQFPVNKTHIPNVTISVTLLSPDPEIKYGQASFSVNTRERELDIAVRSDKDTYMPGEKVALSVDVTDFKGVGAQTQLSVAVADVSVLALKGNPKKNPVPFFYGGFPNTVSTLSNIKNILHVIDVASNTKGGGGANPDDLAKKKRGEFKDTAFWQAVLVTDANGHASASFTLPDNLTAWQIETVGITKDTNVGVGYAEFKTKKQVMLEPLKPRFVVPGDIFSIGAKVFNQTDAKQKLDVSFASDTLVLREGNLNRSITLNAGETTIVYYRVEAPQNRQYGEHAFTVSAQNEAYADSVDQSIAITRNTTYETVATAGMSANEVIDEYVFVPSAVIKDQGGLTVTHSATLAVFLSDALNSVLAFPHGCSEQVASKLGSLAVIKRGLNLKNVGESFTLNDIQFEGERYTLDQLVEVGLARLYEDQNEDGGFSYYPGGQSNPYVTLSVANALKDLESAGYPINQSALISAFGYINDNVYRDEFKNDNFVIVSAYTVYRIGNPANVRSEYKNRINSIVGNQKLLVEGLSSLSLSHLALLLAEQKSIFGDKSMEKVFGILENRIDIDARGAFLPPLDTQYMWAYYETPVKNTAYMLKAFVAAKRNNEILDRILRWLLASRAKDGAWGSTNNTISVIDAMTQYMAWQKENESQFDLSITVDGEEKDSFSYGPQTILAQNIVSVSMADIEQNKLNAVLLQKSNQNNMRNNVYYDVSLTYYLPIQNIPPRDEGFYIERAYYQLSDTEKEHPIASAKAGEVLRGELKIIVPEGRTMVAIDNYIPAGVSLINFNLATEDASIQAQHDKNSSSYYYSYDPNESRKLYADLEELRTDRVFLFREHLPAGEYTYTYFVRAGIPGEYNQLPAVISEWYFPENFGRTTGSIFTVTE